MKSALLILALWVPSDALAGPRVVIDPGHGGIQEGAIGIGGLLEKKLCLELSFRLKAALEKLLFATVVLTRDEDVQVSLSDRVALANEQHPDLFLSLHANSMPTRKQRQATSGIETYFLSASASDGDVQSLAARENAGSVQAQPQSEDTLAFILADLQRTEAHAESSRLAHAIQRQLVSATGAADRGVQQAPFYVLMGVRAPAVMVEVGFVTHPDEGQKLLSAAYQEILAQAIARGVKDFFAQQPRAPASVASPE